MAKAICNWMRTCHVILVCAGNYATFSRWIEREMDMAKRSFAHPKPVIAIKPWGNDNMSTKARGQADRIVNWNTSNIVSAIRELA